MAPGLARRSRRRGRVGRWGLLPLLFLFLLNQGLAAQTESASHLRLGLTLGGMSLVGVAVEYEREGRSVDLAIGTWSFDDISLSIAAKQYLGVGATRPFVGFGAWGVFASSEEGRGGVLVLRAPVGVDGAWMERSLPRIRHQHQSGSKGMANRSGRRHSRDVSTAPTPGTVLSLAPLGVRGVVRPRVTPTALRPRVALPLGTRQPLHWG